MRSRLAAAAAAALAALCWLAVAAPAQEVEGAEVVVRLEDPRIYESSGLALSRRHQAVLWTHNDSGGAPELYAVGADGEKLATLTLAGAQARDWEAIAAGRDDRGRPALFVGDIGDNNGVWPEVAVYRVAEPAELRDATVPAVRFRLRYADGPRDAEALLVDPRGNRLYVATKDAAGGSLYRAPARLRTGQVNVLRRVTRVPPLITDGAFAPDGRGFVLRDYQGAFVYAAPGRRVGDFALPLQFQGESITVSADGRSVLAGSEGPSSEVWRVPLPASALARVTPTTRAASAGATAPAGRPAGPGGGRWGRAALVAVAAALALLATVVLGRRRRR
jgi:Tol biopolymer transport system component